MPIIAMSLLANAPAIASEDRVPEGVSASDWSSIRAAYEANRHAVVAVDDGHQARNPGQAWRTKFDGRGFVTSPDQGGWSWGLNLVSYGRASAEQMMTAPSCTEFAGSRMSYQWDETLTEWYSNDNRGLEHGYIVYQRPTALQSRDDVHTVEYAGLLHFNMAVRGGLAPLVNANKRNVAFVNDAGAAVVNYSNLTVIDAKGAKVPAWFESGESNPRLLRITVDDSNAVYPLSIDPIAQQAYLKASNTGVGDQFGLSVACSGDTVVVGAWREDSSATSVNGNQADNSAVDSGAAYVFVRSGGVWTQQAYLKASNTGASDVFGYSVAISGDTVVVGAAQEDSNATGVNGSQASNSASDSGAAYVFVRSGGVWTQQAYLKASNTGPGDLFGRSVAVSGDTVVVEAMFEDSNATGVNGNQADNSAQDSGAAYVFVRSGTTWTQLAYLKASNTDANDRFGGPVAVNGDTVVVGAAFERSNATGVNGNQVDNSAASAGAAYVFVRSETTWTQQAYLKSSNTGVGDQFGYSVAVSGDTVVVGAHFEASNATGVNGNQANNSATNSGAAYVFVRSGTTWTQQAYLKASNTEASDIFGVSVAASGDTVVVGAYQEDSNATGVDANQADNSASGAGAAYVFVRSAGVWTQQAYLKASNTGAGDVFGISVDVSGDTVVVGAYGESSNATGVNGDQANNSASGSGAAYVFLLPQPCPSDLDGSGEVDGGDLGLILLDFGPCPGCSTDLDGSGEVDGGDVGLTLLDFGPCP